MAQGPGRAQPHHCTGQLWVTHCLLFSFLTLDPGGTDHSPPHWVWRGETTKPSRPFKRVNPDFLGSCGQGWYPGHSWHHTPPPGLYTHPSQHLQRFHPFDVQIVERKDHSLNWKKVWNSAYSSYVTLTNDLKRSPTACTYLLFLSLFIWTSVYITSIGQCELVPTSSKLRENPMGKILSCLTI